MEAIEKISSVVPASFDHNEKPLKKSHQALLRFLKEKIKTNSPITRDDIVNLWIKEVNGDQYRPWCSRYEEKIAYTHPVSGDRLLVDKWNDIPVFSVKLKYGHRTSALTWFKTALGSVIIRGKLLVIPVIDLNEESEEKLK